MIINYLRQVTKISQPNILQRNNNIWKYIISPYQRFKYKSIEYKSFYFIISINNNEFNTINFWHFHYFIN